MDAPISASERKISTHVRTRDAVDKDVYLLEGVSWEQNPLNSLQEDAFLSIQSLSLSSQLFSTTGAWRIHHTSDIIYLFAKKKKAVFLDERRRYVNVFSCVNIVHVTCLGLSAERKKKIYQKLSGCPNFSDEKQKSLLASFLSRHLSYSQQERYNIIHQQNVGEGLCVWTLLTSLSGTWEKNKVLENIICKNDPN